MPLKTTVSITNASSEEHDKKQLTMYYNALVNAELRHATRPRQYFSSI
jgi:hypothetical protein